MRLYVHVPVGKSSPEAIQEQVCVNENQVFESATCLLFHSIYQLPILYYLFLLYVNLKCHFCSASIIAILKDDSSVQWPILVNHNSLGRKRKDPTYSGMESSHLFIAKIANIWQLLYFTSFKKRGLFPSTGACQCI